MRSKETSERDRTTHRANVWWDAPVTIALGTVLAASLIAAASGDAWRFPYQFGDDLLFDLASWRYGDEKLSEEARWIVWLWHEMGVRATPTTSFRVGVILWSTSMTLLAYRLTSGGRVATMVCAAALASSPAVLRLLQWPHTAVPLLATLLLGAVLLFASTTTPRRLALAVAAGACAAMLAYQLFALLLIAAALWMRIARALRSPRWDAPQLLRDVLLVGTCGVIGAVAGLLSAYAFNQAAFGHFGVEIAAWRMQGTPALSRPALAMHNLAAILKSVSALCAHLIGPIAVAAVGVWSVLAKRRSDGVRIVTLVLAVAAGVVVAPATVALLSGAPAPSDRGGLTIWFAVIAVLVLLADLVSVQKRIAVFAAMALLGMAGLVHTGRFLDAQSQIRQEHDHHLARIEAAVRAEAAGKGRIRALIAIGDAHPFATLGNDKGWWVRALLGSRLEPHFVQTVVYCPSLPCSATGELLTPDVLTRMPVYPDPGYIEWRADVMLLRFPAR